MRNGGLITFEGCDGAGKTTQLNLLYDHIKDNWKAPVIKTREPGGTEFGEKIRDIFKTTHDLDMRQQFHLIQAARLEHIKKVIVPALEQGVFVLCDRYIFTTYAYQNETFSEEGWNDYFNQIKAMKAFPDYTIFLDNDFETYKSRMDGKKMDHLEDISEEEFDTRRTHFTYLYDTEAVEFSTIEFSDKNSEEKIAQFIRNDFNIWAI